MVVDVQINPSGMTWAQLLDEVLRAESEGFDAAWVYDHLAGRTLGGDRMLECFTTLGALAVATTRLALGTMVVNMSLRQPAVVAVGAATVQQISGRPFLLGLGAGAGPTSRWAVELLTAEVELAPRMAARHARVTHTLDLCRRLWATGDPETATFPKPDPLPVRLVGVNSEPLARLAAEQADGINLWWGHPQRRELLAAAEEARGGRPGFVRTVWLADADGLLEPDHPTHREVAAAGIDRMIVVRRLAPPP